MKNGLIETRFLLASSWFEGFAVALVEFSGGTHSD